MMERNKIITAINWIGFWVISCAVILAFLIVNGARVFADKYENVRQNYTELHDWRNHVERELNEKLGGYKGYE